MKFSIGTILTLFAAMSLSLGLSGCVGLVLMGAQQLAVGGSDQEQLENSIVDGVTTRPELVQKLGSPVNTMKDGTVLIFGGRSRPRGLVQLVTEDKRDEHRMIAVIDDKDVLREHLWVGRKKLNNEQNKGQNKEAGATEK